jgi:hypothetical protein
VALRLQWLFARALNLMHVHVSSIAMQPELMYAMLTLRCATPLPLSRAQAKDLMNAMLTSRKEADELATQYAIRPVAPPGSAAAAAAAGGEAEAGGEDGAAHLPDVVIMKMLAREALLTVRGHRCVYGARGGGGSCVVKLQACVEWACQCILCVCVKGQVVW